MLRSVHTDRFDSYFVSDFDVGSMRMYSNIIGIGIEQCECTVKHSQSWIFGQYSLSDDSGDPWLLCTTLSSL